MKSDSENFRSTRINAIAIALEVKQEKCLQIINHIKLTENKLGKIQIITSAEERQKCNLLLKRFDTLRNELSSESKDFSDFVELINHEFDSMTQPLEEGIKLLEYKIAEYEYTINQINIEVNRRYSKHEFKK